MFKGIGSTMPSPVREKIGKFKKLGLSQTMICAVFSSRQAAFAIKYVHFLVTLLPGS